MPTNAEAQRTTVTSAAPTAARSRGGASVSATTVMRSSSSCNASAPTECSMGHAHDMTDVAALLGDSTRALMLDALMDGEARPAGELARRAGVAPSTASEHLTRLVEGRLLVVEPRGRERRYRLASAEV